MKTPILFLIFNRPEPTQRVFEEIRKARPEKLFVAADGPRTNYSDDIDRCKEARMISLKIDWPCEVKTLFRDNNLGCKIAVSSAIDWFFENVEAGIILEDDCLPDPSFFPFCEELLGRYRDNESVMMVSGFNAGGSSSAGDSYLFSKYAAIWGWASWRRAWKHYDVSTKSWADAGVRDRIKMRIGDKQVWRSKQWTYDQLYAGTKDTWDYQWEYAILLNSGLSVVPGVNLIENIGVGSQATHTTLDQNHALPQRSSMDRPLQHPPQIAANPEYDSYFTRRYRNDQTFVGKIAARLKSWLG